jgi:hypothetical protein
MGRQRIIREPTTHASAEKVRSAGIEGAGAPGKVRSAGIEGRVSPLGKFDARASKAASRTWEGAIPDV